MTFDLTSTPLQNLREALRAEALRMGFAKAGVASADPLPDVWQRRWQRWRNEAKAGAMQYLMREYPRRTHPRDLLPEARSALVVLAGYYDGDHPPREGEEPAQTSLNRAGKVARYAWGRDYHGVLRERLTRLGQWTAAHAADWGVSEPVTFRPCTDSAPLDERALAVQAGLGWIGKNTLLLDPQQGSWTLIGVLLLSLALPPDAPLAKTTGGCGSCRRCLEACPTGALQGPWRLDPRLCTSYLTIEQKEAIVPELREKMSGWVFGCDLCQEVCPLNAQPFVRRLAELAASEGIGPYLDERTLAETPSGKAFARRWSHTALIRAGLKRLKKMMNDE